MDRTVTPQGRRASTARGYLDQAKPRPNLTIRTHAMTDRILFEGKRAVLARRPCGVTVRSIGPKPSC
ncbi:GMC family oxidoreductase N-terminal domain-containing protein [Enterobacter roggenkampii]|uniref:GMC family oxidoreductase N-terminal domain-containing protein n=1 Tax=Enterobacter roggenkampii TaxID=1812935 RepID=UPI003709B0E3